MYYFEVPTPDGEMEYFYSATAYRLGMPKLVARMANRIWEESDNRVMFIKHPGLEDHHGLMLTPEDLKEFFWVKLQATPAD